MAEEDAEPKGLYMSLDDLISENRHEHAPRGRGGRFRGEGRPMQQGRFDGGAARRQQYLAQRGRGRGQVQGSERPGGGFNGAQVCFNCGEPGHIARDCPNSAVAAGGGPGGQIGPCFNCGQMGHVQRDCPMAGGVSRTITGGAGALGGGIGGPALPLGPGGVLGGPGFGGPGLGGPGLGGLAGPLGGGPMGLGVGMGGPAGLALEELRLQKMLLMQQQQELALLEQQQLAMAAQQQERQRQQAAVQQRQQQQGGQQQGRRPGGAPKNGGGGLPDAYRRYQSCFIEEPSGDVVFRLKETDIVRVSPSGDITLTTGGWYTPTTLASLNDALNVVGIRITAPGGAVEGGDWSITDGRALMRYFDGVVIASKGPQHMTRGRQLLQAFQNPNRSAAAAATAASNAAAAQAGIVPNMGYQPQGGAGNRSSSVFKRLGGRQGSSGQNGAGDQDGFGRMQMDEGEDAGRIRRLKAQGRYNPY
ncbi:hypothetical protein N2152v2_010258 [Parachlorella kessleri]